MLATGGGGIYPGVWARAVASVGPVAAAIRVTGDLALKHDPGYPGKKDRAIVGRADDAYFAGQWRFGELFLGRQVRNWGPPAFAGLQVGREGFSYDHLYARLGPPRLHLSTAVARLDDMPFGGDSVAQRFLSVHRLAVRWRDLEVAVSEAIVYGGVGRGFEPSLANPLTLYDLAQYNEDELGNVSYALDMAWRAGRGGLWSAQLLVDDFQIDQCDRICEEPASLGLALSFDGLPLRGDHRWFASYTRVSNLTYRTPQAYERYAMLGVGLGRDRSDYDEVRAGLDLALLPWASVRPYAALRRQGEGDFRAPFPPPEDYATTPAFLSGTAERTLRVGVTGGARLADLLEVTGDVGLNAARNAEHVGGRSRRRIEGRVRVVLEPRWALSARVGT
jgi:hypothetical protein